MAMTYHVLQLGCQMNISDGERLRTVLEEMGYRYTEDEEQADLLGVVACSVRQKAIDKVYSRIHKWNRWKRERSLLTFVTGCILPADREKFLDRFDLVFAITELPQLPDLIREYGVVTEASLRSAERSAFDQLASQSSSGTAPTEYWKIAPSHGSRFEAYVPIQNGCDKFCSFCAVPYTRGREVSRSSDEILAEISELLGRGYRIITLLGQNVNSYGLDRPGEELSFAELLDRVGRIGEHTPHEFRVYFTSPHPRDMDTKVLETIARYRCLGKQIHLPLQSGDDKVLIAMNRKHSLDRYREVVAEIRRILPDATLFTDIIVGFPGETEQQFARTVEALREFEYNMAYIAMYSPRPGARSARSEDDVPTVEKKRRLHKLTEELQRISEAYNRSLIGNTVTAFVEGDDRKPGYLSGKTEGRLVIRFPSDDRELIGGFVTLKVTDCAPLSLEGVLLGRYEGEGRQLGSAGAAARQGSVGAPRDRRTHSVAFRTLGCKLNQFETEALAAEFVKAGYQVVEDGKADCRVVNTCTVTARADRKSRNTINRALRASADEEAVVVVTGCFAESYRTELEESGVTYVVENDRKRNVFELVDAHFRGEVLHPNQLERDVFSYSVGTGMFRTRGMLKVQDGCDNFCSFCVIPHVRGRAVSRPVPEILSNLEASLAAGYREIVLTGVNMTRYRHNDIAFSGILERVLETPGEFRVRISSIEPDSLDDRFFDLLAHPKLCPHLHLCLQSGSERVLLEMRRQYTAAGFRKIVDRIRAQNSRFNLTTDVIVGFPGESPQDFAETAAFCRELEFSHVHTFPYSPRSGTRAARHAEQVPNVIKRQRAAEIREISESNRVRYRRGFTGYSQQLLLERPAHESSPQADSRAPEGSTGAADQTPRLLGHGYGEHYVPIALYGIGGSAERSRFRAAPNTFVDVTISGLSDDPDPVLEAVPSQSSPTTRIGAGPHSPGTVDRRE